ncbi:Bacterial extracellular solute-binding protein, family 5 Middle [Caulifigura coniformis]|uniref:Bacterial extracellular solute-binding protein, family 5 Middle n=1 Tax=Caulifigura coniformis TaxID=2527983 RepID=A0A517SFB5_9PLAN|nr:ABC transporter substrate-binding protein [Caulifigura coniformis]QDT54826.1 Bacterial extracellular solute-binding protein, family 5 Middle [Caulifigura coniformis]
MVASGKFWRLFFWAILLLPSMAGGLAFAQDPMPPAETPATPPSPEEAAGLVSLPKIQDVPYPSTEELLRGQARDWTILTTDEVIVSESIAPRPATLDQLEAAFKAKEKERRGKTGEELETFKRELDDLRYVNLILPGPPPLDVRVLRNKIARIIHHEDHMLLRVDTLLQEKNIELANELLTQLQRQWPDWPGLAERLQAFLFADASERLAAGDAEACLMLAAELKSRKPDYPGLADLAGRATEQLVRSAQEAGDHIRARYYLMRLDDLFADHPVFQQLSQGYATQAQSLMNEAVTQGKAGKFAEAATLATEAVKAWPRLAALKAPHKAATERYQRLVVGVVRLPGAPKATPFLSEADLRAERLVRHRLFEIDDYRGGVSHYRTAYLDEWEPFDLGRRMKFSLSQTRQPWEAQPAANATQIVAGLTDALDATSPAYDERLASYLKSVTLSSPSEFEVTFARVPVRIESAMRATPLSAVPAVDGDGTLKPVAFEKDSGTSAALPGGFPLVSANEKQVTFRRAIPEPNGLDRYHITEIIEKRYDNHERALRALEEGEVAMLPNLPDWIIRRLRGNKEFEKQYFVQKYAMPTTHVIQLNPRSRSLGFRELRRALFQAIDRERLLYEIVLRDQELADQSKELTRLTRERPAGDADLEKLKVELRDRKATSHGRVTNSPFPQFSYAVSPRLPEQPFDLSSSVAMTIAVAQQMGGTIPILRMAVPPEEIPQAIAKRLVTVWGRVGINVEIVGEEEADSWDLAYRTLQLEEPITDLWTFLTVQPHARVEDLAPFPDWLKQELIALDRSSDWNRAVELCQTLHRHLWSDMRFIPLWELDGYLIYRKQVRGVPQEPLHCYEQIDRWNVEAWYANDAN